MKTGFSKLRLVEKIGAGQFDPGACPAVQTLNAIGDPAMQFVALHVTNSAGLADASVQHICGSRVYRQVDVTATSRDLSGAGGGEYVPSVSGFPFPRSVNHCYYLVNTIRFAVEMNNSMAIRAYRA